MSLALLYETKLKVLVKISWNNYPFWWESIYFLIHQIKDIYFQLIRMGKVKNLVNISVGIKNLKKYYVNNSRSKNKLSVKTYYKVSANYIF